MLLSGSAVLMIWIFSSMSVMQSLDVRRISTMSREGLRALATLTQLTALNADFIGLPFKSSGGAGAVPEMLGLLSCLTGATHCNPRIDQACRTDPSC